MQMKNFKSGEAASAKPSKAFDFETMDICATVLIALWCLTFLSLILLFIFYKHKVRQSQIEQKLGEQVTVDNIGPGNRMNNTNQPEMEIQVEVFQLSSIQSKACLDQQSE